jgi:5-methylcytosine-specific restriction endonuclease McrA
MTTENPDLLPQPAAYVHPYVEKETELFERSWLAPKNLRPEHKRQLKYYWSKKQGRDGTEVMCSTCKVVFGFEQIQVHHIDHNRKNNQLSNIQPACEGCNNDERAQWMSETRKGTRTPHHIGSAMLKKENDTMEATKILQEQLLRQAPPTFQKKFEYMTKTIAYLTEYVKEPKPFDTAVADVEALTGCQHAKAIEYLNGLSVSVFAPWRQWTDQSGQWIAPRTGSEAYKKIQEQTGQ